MRYLPISKLTPGMALGQDIYDGSGRLLLAKHLLLNGQYISSLEFLGFPGVYIDDEFTKGIEIQQIISPEIRSQALKMVYEIFTFDQERQELPVNEVKIRMTVESVVNDILNNGDVMCNMMDIKSYADYMYYHSINVGVLSAMIGAWCELDREDLYQLTTAAMLHDIGKKFIEPDIVNGAWPLKGEEREIWKTHPKLGADFLRNSYNFPSVVYTSVLEHHEWYNGQGYPLEKSNEEILLFARIIKVADCYDSLVSKRPNRKVQMPLETMEYMMAMSGVEFDPNLIRIFVRKIAAYPVGCEIELSNGMHAVVAKNFQDFTMRPLVKIIETGEMLNLRDDPEGRNVTIGKIMTK